MDYFRWNTSPVEDPSLCVLEHSPDGTERTYFMLKDGDPIGPAYPESPPPWRMSRDFPGMKVAAFIANTTRLLVMHRDLKDVLVATGVPLEALPFVLLDHRGAVASRDHFIVNVLGTRDCLNLAASEIVWSEDVPGAVVKIRKYVLDPRKLEGDPDLFRVKEDPAAVILSSRLAKQLKALTPSNLFLWKLEQVPGRA